MRWIEQPDKSYLCGHIAVAVITNRPLEEIVAVINRIKTKDKRKTKGTNTRHLAAALREYGFECEDRLRPVNQFKEKPALAIIKVNHPLRTTGWHWAVIAGDKVYDGAYGKPDGTVEWYRGYRVTSYLPVSASCP